MDPRSFTKRSTLPTLFALGWAAIWPLAAGCQSGAQQDLVARELRLQEDKIYAMEDYLNQYQQLVCKYRSENAALRRRMADEYYDGDELPEPQKAPRADGQRTTPPGGTSIEIRETPTGEGEQPPSREIEIEMPDVPPLEGSTSSESDLTNVQTAAYIEPDASDSHKYAAEAPAAASSVRVHGKSTGKARVQAIIDPSRVSESQDEKHQQTGPGSKAPLRLHGEIVANNLGSGPRLVVNIESTDESQMDVGLDGDVSLMLLVNHGADGDEKLARWDFGREDVQAAKEAASKPGAMQFFLELPADTPIVDSTELWVRLVGHDASKTLAHADVDLAMPGLFASVEPTVPQTAPTSMPAIETVDENEMSIPARIAASLVEGDWSIARPGEPANLRSPEELVNGGWRTSSEPIAVVAQATAVAAPARPVVQQASHVEDLADRQPPRTYKPPTWSPDRPCKVVTRPNDSARKEAALSKRPAWSATR
ncbi:MAG TPA: hypothetical protein VHK01_00440 [Lacipirellulaceae bacterium]|nr:hypothetical protein [Lacipirellulaceae bacterium]